MASSHPQLLYHNKYVTHGAAASAGIVSLCLCLHDQCPRGVSVEILVALLCSENVLLRLAAFLLLPGAELLSAERETKRNKYE